MLIPLILAGGALAVGGLIAKSLVGKKWIRYRVSTEVEPQFEEFLRLSKVEHIKHGGGVFDVHVTPAERLQIKSTWAI